MSMALMAVAMLGTALLPTHAQAGGAFLALRCVMATLGGEYPAVSFYLLEGARPGRRGLVTALASMASEIGVLLAVAVSAIATFRVGVDYLLCRRHLRADRPDAGLRLSGGQLVVALAVLPVLPRMRETFGKRF